MHSTRGFFGFRLPIRAITGLLATTAVLALLLAFHQVVQGAVQQGESRRQAAAALADATWRCKALRGVDHARDCLNGLNGLNGLDAQARAIARPDLNAALPPQAAVLLGRAAPSDGAATRLVPQSSSRTDHPASPRGLRQPTD